jgi:pyruvate dehydrogenase E2 component (dihydrolipoamide acetyltransferase)
MPKLGLTMTEATLVEWKVAVGERVTAGHTLFIIETDKATEDVQARSTGVIHSLAIAAGSTVKVGATVGTITIDNAPDETSR